MKKLIVILASMVPAWLMATEPQDTSLVVNGKHIVVNEQGNNVNVEVFDSLGNALHKTFEGHYSAAQDEERVYVSSPFFPRKRGFVEFTSRHPTFWLGYCFPTDGAFSTGKADGLHQLNSKSWEWGVNFVSFENSLNRLNNMGWNLNLGISNTHLHFQDDYFLMRDGQGNVLMEQSMERLSKSYISYWTLSLSATVEKQWQIGHHRLAVGIGPLVGYHFGGHSRYKAGGHKHTLTNDINLNALGLGYEANVRFGGLSLYLRQWLTPLLDKRHSPTCYPITLALGF